MGEARVGHPGLEEAKRAWATNYAGLSQEQIDGRVLAFATLVRGIARAGAVSPEEFASAKRAAHQPTEREERHER